MATVFLLVLLIVCTPDDQRSTPHTIIVALPRFTCEWQHGSTWCPDRQKKINKQVWVVVVVVIKLEQRKRLASLLTHLDATSSPSS